MSTISKKQIDEFLNALQLSTNSVIKGGHVHNQIFITEFASDSRHDPACKLFLKIVDGHWSQDGACLKFQLKDENYLKMLWAMLMLTRLENSNLKSLVQSDKNFLWLESFLSSSKSTESHVLKDIKHSAQAIFNAVKNKNLTTRELSELTGISQVSLFRFKQGNDIRLSNFLQIANSLGLELGLKAKK